MTVLSRAENQALADALLLWRVKLLRRMPRIDARHLLDRHKDASLGLVLSDVALRVQERLTSEEKRTIIEIGA